MSTLICDSKRESGGGLLEGHTYAWYSPALLPPTSLKNSKPSQPCYDELYCGPCYPQMFTQQTVTTRMVPPPAIENFGNANNC